MPEFDLHLLIIYLSMKLCQAGKAKARRGSVKVLITHFRLAERTSSELFVRDVASLLHSGGHEVAVFASRLGGLGEELRREGIAVADHPFAGSFRPDMIHGQGSLEAMIAILAHPGVPAVFLTQGGGAWRDEPPLHPRIFRYLATTVGARAFLQRERNLPPGRVSDLPELVDTRGVGEPKRVPIRPVTALYCDSLSGVAREGSMLGRACLELGIRLDTLSDLAGRTTGRVEDLLPRYDLVFASGRTVLQALAAGCGVVPVSQGSFGDLITVENWEKGVQSDFAMRRPVKGESVLAAEMVAEIDEAWDWPLLSPLAERVRGRHGESAVRERLTAIYQEVLTEAAMAGRGGGEESELPAVAHWLLDLAGRHHQLDVGYLELQQKASFLRSDRQRMDGQSQALASQLEVEREKLRLVRRLLQGGGMMHHGLKRRIEEGWREIEEREGGVLGGLEGEALVDLSG